MARLLVIDDDPIVLDMFKDIIELLEHDAVKLSSAKAALDYLRTGKNVDLIITDVFMPDLAGDDLVQAIIDDPALPNIPVLLVSGMRIGNRCSELLKRDYIRFISKPIRVNELIREINSLLQSAESGMLIGNN